MQFNCDKFEFFHYWPRGQTTGTMYTSPDGSPIQEKDHLRDLGVEMTSDLTFNTHINNVVSAATKLVGWTLRSFRSRSKHVMFSLWKSLIQSKPVYTSQLWSPSDQANKGHLESVARNFTA